MEPYTRGRCNQLHGLQLAGRYRFVHKVPLHSCDSVNLNEVNYRLARARFCSFRASAYYCDKNAPNYRSEEFQVYYKERGIVHLTSAPYHSATNWAAERLIQTFKQALRKSSEPPKKAVVEFLMQYWRTPTALG